MSEEMLLCNLCQVQTPNLVRVDSGLRLGMQKEGVTLVPDEVCGDCLKTWRKKISAGVKLVADKEVRENLTTDLWRGRLQCVRHGRTFFSSKVYPEAASCYEKYIKILEVVCKSSFAAMDPGQFRSKPKEITILCTVLWDLMLIYDAEPKLASKQSLVAKKLAEFSKYSKIYSGLVRKAEIECRRAKNPAAFKEFLTACDVKIGRCFIANAAFATPENPTVRRLCQFRDQVLLRSPMGLRFVETYYKYSPEVADAVDAHPWMKRPLRVLLRLVAAPLPLVFPLQGLPDVLTWWEWLPSKIKKLKKSIIP